MKSLVLAVFLLLGAVSSATLFGANAAHAVSGSDWRAGRIIDDGIFYDNNAMSLGDIQNFLNSKVPTCDTQGTQSAADLGYPGMTHAQYAASRGWPGPPYICLKDYYQVPRSDAVVNNFSGSIPAGSWSAAQIIKNAADTYSVSPRALLVTLQKESPGPLISDTWPLQSQYRNAMGYGCPDTAPCDPAYEGFYNQMSNAARQFKLYKDNPANYRYKPNQTNSIYFNPNTGCGASNVYLETFATAGLYNYTPYQPNQAALNNLYGTGDGCSAYGNRNFWRIWNDWFGSPLGLNYYAAYSAESNFPTLEQNQKSTVFIRYKNMGSQSWYDSATASAHGTQPVVLATMGPVNRCSAFVDTSWYSCTRPAGLFSKVYEQDGVTLAADQHVAMPTQIVEYSFVVAAPDDEYVGKYSEYFAPIREGAPGWGWYMGADNVFLNINLTNGYRASYNAQSPYATIFQNDRSPAFIRYKNTGSAPWYDNTSAQAAGVKPVVLATDGPVNRQSPLGPSWPNSARAGEVFSRVYEQDGLTLATNQHKVLTGQIAEYSFTFTATPSLQPQLYREYFQLLREGARSWPVDSSGAYLDVTVKASKYGAAYSSQSPYQSVSPNDSTKKMYFDMKNTGESPWYDDSAWTPGIHTVRLATSWPINRASAFAHNSWLNATRPSNIFSKVYEQDGVTLAANQHIAQPGQIARFEFTLKAPSAVGTYDEYFQPIIEGAPGWTWNMGGVVWQRITVQ